MVTGGNCYGSEFSALGTDQVAKKRIGAKLHESLNIRTTKSKLADVNSEKKVVGVSL